MNDNVTSIEEYKKNRDDQVTDLPSQTNYYTSEDILFAIGVIISIFLPRSVYAVYADSGVASLVFGSVVAGTALGLTAYWKWPFELVSMGLWVAPRAARRTDKVELRKAA